MGKTDLTKSIEKKLIQRFMGTATRYALEIPMSIHTSKGFEYGIVDFVTVDIQGGNFPNKIPYITNYEIKVSVNDFKSKNGHNFYGDKNYYVVSEEVWEYFQKNNVAYGKGVYLFKNGKLYEKRIPDNWHKSQLTIEQRIGVLDNIIIKWESGTMYREITYHHLKLRNY